MSKNSIINLLKIGIFAAAFFAAFAIFAVIPHGTNQAKADCAYLFSNDGCKGPGGDLCNYDKNQYSCDGSGNVSEIGYEQSCPTEGSGYRPGQDTEPGAGDTCGHGACTLYDGAYCVAAVDPSVTLTATPLSVTVGSPVTLSWTSQNSNKCTASSTEGDWSGTVATSSSGFVVTPPTVGQDTYLITCGAIKRATDSATVDVTSGAQGTLNVQSTNSQTGNVVNSTWNIDGADENLCDEVGCNGNGEMYPITAFGNYTVYPVSASGYAVGPVVEKNIAQTSNPIIAFLKQLVGNAEAYTYCSMINGSPLSCPSNSVNVNNPGDVGTIIIQWYPIASMRIAPTSIPITLPSSSPGTVTFAIGDNGTPGSILDWTANADPSASWATFGGNTTTNGNVSQGSASSTVTVNIDPSGLAVGAYSANLTINGVSQIDGKHLTSQSVTINLTVKKGGGGGGGKPPTATLTANPTVIQLYSQTTTQLTWTTKNASSCNASANPGEGDWSGTLSSVNSSQIVAPTQAGNQNYMIACFNGAGAEADATATVQVNPPATPACTMTADPTSVIIPNSSDVHYDCTNINVPPENCGLTTTDPNQSIPAVNYVKGGTEAKGDWTVTPIGLTTYKIICSDPFGTVTGSSSVTVSVTNPFGVECPPQGCTP